MLFWLGIFSAPSIVSAFLWYDVIAKTGLLSIFRHSDLFIQNPNLGPSTYFFSTNFLVSYGLGWIFIDAVIFSIVIGLLGWRLFPYFRFFDLAAVSAIATVIGVNTFLGAALDLHAPFMNAFKYDYQALPFFCFLAASLTGKSLLLLSRAKAQNKKWVTRGTVVGIVGLMLIAGTIYFSMQTTNLFSSREYFIFRVEPGVDAGYSLFDVAPLVPGNALVWVQFTGFAVTLTGLLWIGKDRLSWIGRRFLSRMRNNDESS
jgi:hypothetical protein